MKVASTSAQGSAVREGVRAFEHSDEGVVAAQCPEYLLTAALSCPEGLGR